MAGHSPTPWQLDGKGIRTLVRGNDFTIVAVRHRLLGDIHEANAALIVKAVNAWDDVDALLARVAELQRDPPMSQEQAEDISRRAS